MKPKVCVLRTDGTNCDEELFYAFKKFGGAPEYVHVNQLRDKDKRLQNYQILALPGGFTYGDDIASGKILAVELISFLKDELVNFIEMGRLVLGICNGFQTIVRTGLLPFGNIGNMAATLAQNESGHFECRWIRIKIEKSKCVFLDPRNLTSGVRKGDAMHTPGVDKVVLEIPVNHGEGRFFASDEIFQKIENQNLVAFRYVDENGQHTQKYPFNPNGSLNAIAGICDPSGRILGLMPHPEKFVDITQHPNWRRFDKKIRPHGAVIFESMIRFANQS